MIEFQGWPKIPRLFRDMVITEKIDGTNSAVIIERCAGDACEPAPVAIDVSTYEGDFHVGAQSRKRLIHPDADNFGFAQWVWNNSSALVDVLGEGRHFGEWWGSGIQRGYGLPKGEKRFSLFNVKRYATADHPLARVPALDIVPVLYQGSFRTCDVFATMEHLRREGSLAAPGFMRPEGVVVYHSALNGVFKVTLENDEAPKGQGA